MKIEIANAVELGMPEDMMANCKQLLEWRIQKIMTTIPEPGTNLEVLYSEKDPLGDSDVVDDEAYFVYFTIEAASGSSLENAEITAALVG